MSKGIVFKANGDKFYPVPYYQIGDLHLTTRKDNPSLVYGGEWELYGAGRVLVCVDVNDSDFNEVGKTGGTKDTLLQYITSGYGLQPGSYAFSDRSVAGKPALTQDSFDKGNVPPYITCYIWRRIK